MFTLTVGVGYRVSLYSDLGEAGVETFTLLERDKALRAFTVRSNYPKPELLSHVIEEIKGYDFKHFTRRMKQPSFYIKNKYSVKRVN